VGAGGNHLLPIFPCRGVPPTYLHGGICQPDPPMTKLHLQIFRRSGSWRSIQAVTRLFGQDLVANGRSNSLGNAMHIGGVHHNLAHRFFFFQSAVKLMDRRQ
jgi:hypothetical protein